MDSIWRVWISRESEQTNLGLKITILFPIIFRFAQSPVATSIRSTLHWHHLSPRLEFVSKMSRLKWWKTHTLYFRNHLLFKLAPEHILVVVGSIIEREPFRKRSRLFGLLPTIVMSCIVRLTFETLYKNNNWNTIERKHSRSDQEYSKSLVFSVRSHIFKGCWFVCCFIIDSFTKYSIVERPSFRGIFYRKVFMSKQETKRHLAWCYCLILYYSANLQRRAKRVQKCYSQRKEGRKECIALANSSFEKYIGIKPVSLVVNQLVMWLNLEAIFGLTFGHATLNAKSRFGFRPRLLNSAHKVEYFHQIDDRCK